MSAFVSTALDPDDRRGPGASLRFGDAHRKHERNDQYEALARVKRQVENRCRCCQPERLEDRKVGAAGNDHGV